PELPTYSAKIGEAPASPARRATSESFYVPSNIGSKLAKFGETYLDVTEADESRKALVASSEIRAKHTRQLDAAALSGADTAKIKEDMQAEFAKVGENFQTKKGTESLQLYTSNTELMFDEQANRIKVHRAAATARVDGQKFLNSAGDLVQRDASYLP